MADTKSKTCSFGITITSDETFKNMVEILIGNAASCVFNDDDELIAHIVITHTHLSCRSVLHRIEHDFVDDDADVRVIYFYDQFAEWVPNNIIYACHLVMRPGCLYF